MLSLGKAVLLSKKETDVEVEQESTNLHKSKMVATADTDFFLTTCTRDLFNASFLTNLRMMNLFMGLFL